MIWPMVAASQSYTVSKDPARVSRYNTTSCAATAGGCFCFGPARVPAMRAPGQTTAQGGRRRKSRPGSSTDGPSVVSIGSTQKPTEEYRPRKRGGARGSGRYWTLTRAPFPPTATATAEDGKQPFTRRLSALLLRLPPKNPYRRSSKTGRNDRSGTGCQGARDITPLAVLMLPGTKCSP